MRFSGFLESSNKSRTNFKPQIFMTSVSQKSIREQNFYFKDNKETLENNYYRLLEEYTHSKNREI